MQHRLEAGATLLEKRRSRVNMTATRFGWRSLVNWSMAVGLWTAMPWAAVAEERPPAPPAQDSPQLDLVNGGAHSAVLRANAVPAGAGSGKDSRDGGCERGFSHQQGKDSRDGACDPPEADAGGGSHQRDGASAEQAEQVVSPAADAITTWFEETVKPASSVDSPLLRRDRGGQAAPTTAGPATTGSTAGGGIRLLWPLLIVLLVITMLAVALRRWVWRGSRFGAGGVLEILTRHHLSPKQSLCLVKLGRRVLLVGITPDSITAVASIDNPEEVAAIIASLERAKPKSFTAMFARATERDWGKDSGGLSAEDVPLAGGQLAATGVNVRDLIQRVRSLSTGKAASAEPTA